VRRVAYRVRQFFRGFRVFLSPNEVVAVRAALTDRELELFLRMPARDRRQAVDIMDWLRQRTTPSDDLLAAALLHDAGKGAPGVWDRVAFVLLEAVSARLTDRAAAEHGARWRRSLWTLRHHARLGAELLLEAGSGPRVTELVARHTERAAQPSDEANEELAWLIAADGAC
jgi:HD domain